MRSLLPFFLLVFCFSNCERERPTFRDFQPYTFQDSLQQKTIDDWLGERPEGQALTNWLYTEGDSSEELIVATSAIPDTGEWVRLPHRINQPNTALWYQTKVQVEQAEILWVNTDDGAQVFYDGQQLRQQFPNGFLLWPTNDSTRLVVRVLNNALKGGLRQAALIAEADALAYFGRLDSVIYRMFPKEGKGPLRWAKPYVQQLVPGTLSIRVLLDDPQEAELIYGPSSSLLDHTILSTNLNGWLADFELEQVDRAATTFYQIRQGRVVSEVFELKPTADKPDFAFTAWGDSQGGWQVFQQLIGRMGEDEPDFSIGLGDLVSDGSQAAQWLGFLYAWQPLASQIPVYPVIGNHDYDGYYDDLVPALYRQYIREKTYFSWAHGNSIFVALDPNERFPLGIEGAQHAWFLEQIDSEAWQRATWRFVLLHQPPYSQGWPDYHGDDFIRELIEEYAEPAGIDFVLSGHSHCYERLTKSFGTQQTHFLILGGAGGGLEPPVSSTYPQMDTVIKAHHYGLFDVEAEKVSLRVIGLNGEVLDQVDFR